ncbi:L-serine ammonia-lyase, iron-sulfur-dependent, subunit alpha [Gemmiger sp.]|uniref:L-serine ammonia-lyase, iron-sulfur-dependent, subunit alpha n=1 Tax=Gemmiger sp. TaxID=2049027 RepID=UPI003FD78270
MAFSSVRDMVELCKETGRPLYEVILESDLTESGLTRAESEAEMHRLWSVMCATSAGYCSTDRSMSGFAGGDAAKVSEAAARGILYADGYFADVMAEALKTAECNACMKRIVAAPTAGSCGVLPAVLLPLWRRGLADEAAIHRALYIAAGFGQVVAARATLAGAEGGCQAEVGAASAMAAAALVDIRGGTAEQCAEAFAMALTNLEGLVCDPVAGLVEIPCIKRNVIGAMNAVSAADMALAGVVGHIPADEVIDAMAEVGNAMSQDLRETGIGGLAGTPTGRAICEIVTMNGREEEA